jgi:predicted DNA-binding ArsR family transcriptional regulator
MDNVITRDSVYFNELVNIIKTMETEVEMMKDGNLSCTGKWMNGDAVMQKLGISRRTLQNYRDNGILPYSAVGGKFYYSIRDIEDLMARNYVSEER